MNKLFVMLIFLTSLPSFANTHNCRGKVRFTNTITEISKEYKFEFFVTTHISSCNEIKPENSRVRFWPNRCFPLTPFCPRNSVPMRPRLTCSKYAKTNIHLVHSDFEHSNSSGEKVELNSNLKTLGRFDSLKFSLTLDGESSEYFSVEGEVEVSKIKAGAKYKTWCRSSYRKVYKQMDLSEHTSYQSGGCGNYELADDLSSQGLETKLTVSCY